MIQAKDLHKYNSLEEFYREIRRQQEIGHGNDYCRHHDAITKYLKKGMSYKELGTHQGATAACACLCFPSSIELVDISMNLFNPSKKIFENFCIKNEIEMTTKEISSIDLKSISNKNVDVLLVDSLHQPHHLTKELEIHSGYISKYMIFHDTSLPNEKLFHVLENFVKVNKNFWEIHERNMENVGYTVLKRIDS